LFIPTSLLTPKESIVGHFDNWSMLGLLFSFVAVSGYTTGALFSQKSIGDTISTGFSRRQVYFAKILVNVMFCTAILILNLITIYLSVYFINSGCNPALFENIPAKFIMTLFACLFYIVVLTALAFIAKTPVGGVIIGYLALIVGPNLIILGLMYLTGTANDGFNFLYFFNNFFFRFTFFLDDINNYIFSVSGIYLILTVIFYLIGERSFRKSDLK
jgi:ABC-type transport system involved in multi-copper enzyme maturation permease subunit